MDIICSHFTRSLKMHILFNLWPNNSHLCSKKKVPFTRESNISWAPAILQGMVLIDIPYVIWMLQLISVFIKIMYLWQLNSYQHIILLCGATVRNEEYGFWDYDSDVFHIFPTVFTLMRSRDENWFDSKILMISWAISLYNICLLGGNIFKELAFPSLVYRRNTWLAC